MALIFTLGLCDLERRMEQLLDGSRVRETRSRTRETR